MLAFYLIDYFASTVIPDLGGYSDFTYSTEEKGYILAKEEKNEYEDYIFEQKLIVKFAEGKLKAIKYYQTEFVYNEEDEIIGEKEDIANEWLLYFTYGGQSVTRPEVSE